MQAASDRPQACRNCGASLQVIPAARFCGQCGQETMLHAPTFGEFLHEFAGHFVAVEGALWRTLRLLFTAPGRLSNEYFAGRRRRYVAPLRLYLSASFIFFLVLKIAVATGGFQVAVAGIDQHGRPNQWASDPVAHQTAIDQLQHCIDAPGACSSFSRMNARIGLKAMQLSDRSELVTEHLVGMAPYALFFLLPLLAAIVMLAYRRRRAPYGAHFVFALHTYSFALLLLALAVALPEPATFVATLVVLGYGYLSMRAVYGGRRWATALRFALVCFLYAIALTVALVALSIGSVLVT